MQQVRVRESCGRGTAILALSLLGLLTAGCGGSSSPGSGSASTSSGAPPPSGGGGTGGGTGTGTSSTTTLFEQPQLGGIAGNFVVPVATHTPPPKGAFTLVLWQADKFMTNGLLVPTGWDAGTDTGFTPSTAMAAQLGFQNKPGTSTAQAEADTVGAYINSQDLPVSSADQKMMITPQYIFPLGSQPMPFASSPSLLGGALELQIPTAAGAEAYVVADLLFMDLNGVRISYGIKIFSTGGVHPVVGSGYASDSNTYTLNSPLGVDERFVTKASASGSATGTPWSGWRHFEWSISQAQFVSGLNYLTTQFPGKVTSTDPAHYVLAEVHLNAEFHTMGQPAELGWSMRGLKLWTTP